MSDHRSRFREGFDQLLSEMPDPPTLDALSSRPAELQDSPRRRGALVAFAMGAAVVLVAGAALIALRGGQDPAQPANVEYVKLEWSQHFELRCLGMEIVDNGGFDDAVIEIWGPNTDNLIRMDTTAPDGTVTRVVVEPSTTSFSAQRIWSTGTKRFNEAGYRVSDCLEENSGNTSSFAMAQPPEFISGSGYELWLPIVQRVRDGSVLDLEEIYSRDATARTEVWRGTPVTVYTIERSGTDEMGDFSSTFERWYDSDRQRLEKWIIESDNEVLGSGTTTYTVIDRQTLPESNVSFEIDDLTLVFDQSEYETSDVEVSVTTSIPPLGLPLMVDAVEITTADIPNGDLEELIAAEEGDQLYAIHATEGASIYVRLRAADRHRMYATSCDVLTSVELPEAWIGTCLERTVEGQRITGKFSYREASE